MIVLLVLTYSQNLKTFQSNSFLQIIASQSFVIIEQSFMLHFQSLTKYGVVSIYQIKEQKLIKQMNYKVYHKQNKGGWQIRLNEISHEQAFEINSLFVICTLFYL
ncbi:Hypothetical_protein [Hexamita inflata]|uniref:Hypothetical_protein n=1 Tax=Hexamita inflata TaxID=28002 RepID=A0AA86QH74_9EUKA|nr:Hypothetical protein HINF_LOCUS43902 [Hexamita inflata]